MAGLKKQYETSVIYGLFDPRDNSLRYIGQTVSPLCIRLCGHVSSAKVPVLPKDYWVLELLKMGMRPVIREIETVSIYERDRAEKRWIQHYREQGCDLLNRQGITTALFRKTEEYKRLRAEREEEEPDFETLEEAVEYRRKKNREFYQLVKRSWDNQQAQA